MRIASMNMYMQSHYLLVSINWKDIWINLDITYNEFT